MGEHWSLESVHHLRTLALEKTPVPVIAMTMRRGVGEVHAKLAELGLAAPMGDDAGKDREQAGTRGDESQGSTTGFGLMGGDRDRETGMKSPPQPEPGSASF